MAVKFTEDQNRAITTLGSNIIVSAGAGSGKTAVLSERVLYLVKEKGFHLQDFLILTFTRLAAGEMKERIRKKLYENNLEEANEVDRADITTFDAYALSLVKKYHAELNLPRDIDLVDSSVISVYKRKCLDEIFHAHYVAKDLEFENLVLKHSFKDDNNLKSIILKLQNKADLSIDKKAFLQRVESRLSSEDFKTMILNNYALLLKKQIEEISLMIDKMDQYNEYVCDIKSLIATIDGDFDSLVNQITALTLPRAKGLDENDSNINKKVKDKIGDLKELVNYYSSRERLGTEMRYFQDDIPLIVTLTKELDERQWQFKTEHAAYEFEDIAKFALSLVRDFPNIRSEIKNGLKMIMVDEYQDTSTLQDLFISYIAKDNIYMVGDIKQSIYRFRNANSDIFQEKYEKYAALNGGKKIDLKANFRSRKEVIADINDIFQQIMSLKLGGADYKKDHIIESGNKSYDQAGNCQDDHHITCLTYSSDLKSNEREEIEARIIASDIKKKIEKQYQIYDYIDGKEVLRPIRFDDICILMDRGTSFSLYKKIFTEYQIPLYIENDENIVDNALLKVLINLLKVISYIRDNKTFDDALKHSFFSLLRSFIFSKNDQYIFELREDEKYVSSAEFIFIKQIVDEKRHLSLDLLYKEVIFALDIYSKLILIGDVKMYERYVDLFVSSLSMMVRLEYSLDDAIDYFIHIGEYNLKFNVRAVSSSLDAVKIMNIHKSKGLEFSLIYYSGFTRAFNEKDYNSLYGFSDDYGLLLPNNKHQKGLLHFLYQNEEKQKDLSEKIRLLYVALTRAKEKIIIVLPEFEEAKPLVKAKSFYDIFAPFIQKFEHLQGLVLESTNDDKEIEHQNKIKLILKEMNYSFEKEQKLVSSSKSLDLNSQISSMDYGTKLHRYLEFLDFKNPNYDAIDDYEAKKHIIAFINSDLLQNIEKAKILKEYEFIDELTESHGIIDLLIIKEDKTIIIDYKTKNISESAYDKQIITYCNYVTRIFNLPCEAYLYSLIDHNYRKIR